VGETVTKLQAAKRQLSVAIRLFFGRADPLAIHTLVSAAYQIVWDLTKNRSAMSIVKGNARIRPEKQEEWERILNRAQSFLKHADRDPLGTLDFEPEIIRFFLFDAIVLYGQLTSSPFHEGTVYMTWFALKYQNLLLDGAVKDMAVGSLQRGLDPDDFEFIQTMLRNTNAT